MTKCCTKKEGPYGYTYGISAETILKMAEEELLKSGVVQKPAEWSEEDKEMLGKVLECIRFAEDHYQLEQEETNGVSVKSWVLDHTIPQPKNEWSEEDEKYRKWCISHFKECSYASKDNLEFKQYLNNKIIPWLEKQKPLEWSDKDEKMKESIIKALYGGGHFAYEPEITWLKSLRPQSKQMISQDTEVLMAKLINLLKSYRIGEETATTLANRIADTYGAQRYMNGLCDSGKLHWKPSEEQIKAIESCFCEFGEGYPDEDGLRSLYNDLKKLM